MSKKYHLVIIDPQNSFCKKVPDAEQQANHDGELFVPGAWEDMVRLADFIDKNGHLLDDITITLDSHHLLHIAHPTWFRDMSGKQPAPFTVMRERNGEIIGGVYDANGNLNDIGRFMTYAAGETHNWTLKYLHTLETTNRYLHMIWPPHCLIGTPGHNIVAPLMEAIFRWEAKNKAFASKVTKGSCIYTEHFGAVKAEVLFPGDPSTALNPDFVRPLSESDVVLVAGEASTHCVANTVRDTDAEFGDGSFARKCVILQDAMSPVPNLEHLADKFFADMKAKGVQFTTTKDWAA